MKWTDSLDIAIELAEAHPEIDPRTIRSCMHQGWAEPWFMNPLKPDWLVCKLTPAGRAILSQP